MDGWMDGWILRKIHIYNIMLVQAGMTPGHFGLAAYSYIYICIKGLVSSIYVYISLQNPCAGRKRARSFRARAARGRAGLAPAPASPRPLTLVSPPRPSARP